MYIPFPASGPPYLRHPYPYLSVTLTLGPPCRDIFITFSPFPFCRPRVAYVFCFCQYFLFLFTLFALHLDLFFSVFCTLPGDRGVCPGQEWVAPRFYMNLSWNIKHSRKRPCKIKMGRIFTLVADKHL